MQRCICASAGARGSRETSIEPVRSTTTSSPLNGFPSLACSSPEAGSRISRSPTPVATATSADTTCGSRCLRSGPSAQPASSRRARLRAPTQSIDTCKMTSTTLRGRPARRSWSGGSGSHTQASQASRCACCCNPSTPTRQTGTLPPPLRPFVTTANGSGAIPTHRSPSSIRHFKAPRPAEATQRCSSPARGGWRRRAVTNPNQQPSRAPVTSSGRASSRPTWWTTRGWARA